MDSLSSTAQLWKSTNLEDWKKVQESYYDMIREHKVYELERWFRETLPGIMVTQNYLTKEQGIKLIQWKGTRGKFRPALVKYAREQDGDALRQASKDAFDILRSGSNGDSIDAKYVMEALSRLTELRGIGPATASAILAAMDERVPFMSDEALLICLGKREYTAKAYRNLLDCMNHKYKEISDATTGSHDLSIKDIEAALFATSVQHEKNTVVEKKVTKKRKASS